MDSARELEEERRLFYVAITRAEERCFITYAKSRFRNGQLNFVNPSRFIKDIDSKYLDFPVQQTILSSSNFMDEEIENFSGFRNVGTRFTRTSTRTYYPKQQSEKKPVCYDTPNPARKLTRLESSSATSATNADLNETFTPTIPVGKFVKHSMFGIGKVLSVSMSGANEKAEIDFGEKGVKTLLLKFAKLEVLD
jgi:DNA helicase-2/ATP-dependent DNA helicase PcrA